VWRRCSSQAQSDPPAHFSITRISKDLKNAYAVVDMQQSSITVMLPRTDANGINLVPFQPGKQVRYYIGDAEGDAGESGTILWREQINQVNGARRLALVAGNVEELTFSYESTSERVLVIYAMSITVTGREGREEYRSEFGSHVAFRN
jgi:hypothetical protein